MIKKVKITQTDTGAWAASGTITTQIQRVGLIHRIYAVFEMTPSATLRAAHQFDPLHRTIDTWRLRGGSHTYFTLPSNAGGHAGTLLHYMNMLDGYGVGHRGAAILAPDSTYNYASWLFHAGARLKDKWGFDNEFDMSAFVPAGAESQLVAEWVTTPNSVMDDTVTISSGTMRYTIYRSLGTPADFAEEMAAQEVRYPSGSNGMVPAWSQQAFVPTGTSTEFTAQAVNLITGIYLKRIGLLIQDGTATRPLRASDEVTEIEISAIRASESIVRVGFEHLNGKLPMGTGLHEDAGAAVNAAVATLADPEFNGYVPSGIGFLNLNTQMVTPSNRDYGWNLLNESIGSYRMGFVLDTNATSDTILILWEGYRPYFGQLPT